MNRARNKDTYCGRQMQDGLALVSVVVGLLVATTLIGGLFLIARNAQEAAMPAAKNTELKSFASEMVGLCGNILLVMADQHPSGVSSVNDFLDTLNNDPVLKIDVTQPLNPDPTRTPGGLGTGGLEQEFFAALSSSTPYQNRGWWVYDRTASGAYVPDLQVAKGELTAAVDLDYIGPSSSGLSASGEGGGCGGVIEFADPGKELKNCRGGGASAASPDELYSYFVPGLYRCMVHVGYSNRPQQLTVDTVIRKL